VNGAVGMSDAAIDAALSGMAEAAEVLLREWHAEERRLDELNDTREALLEQQAQTRCVQRMMPDPRMTLITSRWEIASQSAKLHRDTVRELVSWWADAAVVALEAAAMGTPVSPVRLAAADPGSAMEADEVAELPPIDQRTRHLVELAAALGPGLAGSPADRLMPSAEDLASRAGLEIHRNHAGEIAVRDGIRPEARRRRLWGACWIEYRIPQLPGPEEVRQLLAGAPEETTARVCECAEAVSRSVMAEVRVEEHLKATKPPWSPEAIAQYDALSAESDHLTARLAHYAQAITEAVPLVRSAAPAR
jgi:hypothetical protein